HDGVPYKELGPAVGAKAKRVRTARMIRELRKLGYRVEPLALAGIANLGVSGGFSTLSFRRLMPPGAHSDDAGRPPAGSLLLDPRRALAPRDPRACLSPGRAQHFPNLKILHCCVNSPPKRSRSRSRYGGPLSHGNASRSCWVVHSAVGWAVTATCRILRPSAATLWRSGRNWWIPATPAPGYKSVNRFVGKLGGNPSSEAWAVIETAPGEELQVDYGTGPMVRHPHRGKYRRTRRFVLTLGYSRKSVRLVVFRSSAQI